ncbi:MAG: amidohydrolase family protein [Planctomycetota bacterium]
MTARFAACPTLVLALALVLPSIAFAQLGTRESTVLEGATVWVDGAMVENAKLLFSGRRIQGVGAKIKLPDGVDVIDLKGKFVLPSFIDSSALIAGMQPARSRNPEHLVIDNVNLYHRDPFQDAIEGGVGYLYLSGAANSGVGARGLALKMPGMKVDKVADLVLKGSESMHVRLGTNSRGPIARLAEIKSFESYLKNLKTYREGWEKYREKLKKYEEELAEWAKKNKPKSKKSGGAKKSSGAKSKSKPKASPRPKSPSPVKKPKRSRSALGLAGLSWPGFGLGHDDDDDHEDHEDHDDGVEVCDLDGCTIPGQHEIHLHDDWVFESELDGQDHDHERDHLPEQVDPGFAAIFIDPPRLKPELSIIGDGTETHLRRPLLASERLANQKRFSTCPHCGASDPLAPQHIAHTNPWPVDEFDRVAAELEQRYFESYRLDMALADPKPGGPKKRGSKSSSKSSKSKKGAKPKKPKEPGFKPALEVASKALDGKLKVRIEVHRAEDILAVLDVLDRYPLDAVLEGVTEGHYVAEAIAKAELPVVLDAALATPIQEQSLGANRRLGRLPFPALPGSSRTLSPSRTQSDRGPGGLARRGIAHRENAARLVRAGVTVVISSLGAGSESLLARAASAASRGLSRAEALDAITRNAALVLGVGDQIGEFSPGRLASFTVFDGDPFLATSRVEKVYIDGKEIYGK